MNHSPEPVPEPGAGRWIELAESRLGPALRRYVHSLGLRHDLVAEVVQDAFLSACRQAHLPAESERAAWLFRVCRNRAIDVQRKEQRMITGTATCLDRVLDHGDGPAESAAARDASARLETLLAGLSPSQQEIVRLKFQAGLSYREIAEITGLTVSNVGVTLHTALQRIRKKCHED